MTHGVVRAITAREAGLKSTWPLTVSQLSSQILGLQLLDWVGKPQGRAPEQYVYEGHTDKIFSVAFSPDGAHVTSISTDRLHSRLARSSMSIWSAATGNAVSAFLSFPRNANYCKNALILLVRTNCVAIFIGRK